MIHDTGRQLRGESCRAREEIDNDESSNEEDEDGGCPIHENQCRLTRAVWKNTWWAKVKTYKRPIHSTF